jgi:hypothetical protein
MAAGACALLGFSNDALERIEPPQGCYFGFTLGSAKSIPDLSSRVGFTPAVYIEFFNFSDSFTDVASIEAFLDQVAAVQGVAVLTLEPHNGLGQVTQSGCYQIADLCAKAESKMIGGIFIRFAHEMNGNWYPWGQRPTLFKTKFQLLAQTVHARTSRTAMIWAPNYGVGYPFGTPVPQAGSADFLALDTNHDGRINDRDDMYEPYYPGDDAVDWVGMTLYHWGVSFPWLENELPPAGALAKSMVGAYQGSVPNFYGHYCADALHHKPMAITETAAFYNTQMPGPSELSIKQAWWKQVFAAPAQFPMLKCVNWFDELKRESIAQYNLIDWRITGSEPICDTFVSDLRVAGLGSKFLTANETMRLAPYYIAGRSLPDILPVSGSVEVTLDIGAASACDLVINLLDDNSNWQGGARVPITGPTQTITTTFNLAHPLSDFTGYRWSIFLTPRGGDYLSALTWYHGPDPSDDPDGDGVSNEDEHVAGTSPRDADDFLKLQVQHDGVRTTVSWPSKIGRNYQLYATHDFHAWTAVTTILPGTGAELAAPASGESLTMYRLRVTMP